MSTPVLAVNDLSVALPTGADRSHALQEISLTLNAGETLCVVGESGSGKTESTNFLLHHLTALSQKGSQGCGVEQTILSAGPVLEVIIPFSSL